MELISPSLDFCDLSNMDQSLSVWEHFPFGTVPEIPQIYVHALSQHAHETVSRDLAVSILKGHVFWKYSLFDIVKHSS